VEDRLPLLIQKQLNAEIEQRPPLFPWETEVDDYGATEVDSGYPKLINISTSLESVSGDASAQVEAQPTPTDR
jgi:hypothetical protein